MTHTKSLPRFVAAPLLAGAMLLALQADAKACEGCKSSMSADTAAEDAGKGFAASIYFMLSMPVLLIGGISYMAWKNCSSPADPADGLQVLSTLPKPGAAGERELGAFALRAAKE